MLRILNIPHSAEASTWRHAISQNSDLKHSEKKVVTEAAQIDLLFDRPDGIVHLCEIKYCSTPFKIDKQYAQTLMRKIEIYKKVTGTKKQVFLSLIVTAGLQKNIYSEDLIDSVVTLDDLFEG